MKKAMEEKKMAKTRDGLKLEDVVKNIKSVFGKYISRIRQGASHAYLIDFAGYGTIPIAESTDVRRMAAGQIREATNYQWKSNQIYAAIRLGYI